VTAPLFLDGETDFNRHLIVRDLAALNVAAGLEPSNQRMLSMVAEARAMAPWIASSMPVADDPTSSTIL
jgi:hypothetical protein